MLNKFIITLTERIEIYRHNIHNLNSDNNFIVIDLMLKYEICLVTTSDLHVVIYYRRSVNDYYTGTAIIFYFKKFVLNK